MTPLTTALRKRVHQIAQPKWRRQYGEFPAEGTRLVLELLPVMRAHCIVASPEWWELHPEALDMTDEPVTAARRDILELSSLSTPQDVMAVFAIPRHDFDPAEARGGLVLALDTVQDPGNMGTILRAADWFGVHTVLASDTCVDVYNPKVVQATMGALARVKVHRVDLPAAIQALSPMPVYGTFLEGENIYTAGLPQTGVLVMGNEGNGISKPVERLVSHKLNIPSFPAGAPAVESLNVGVATAICLAEFRRRIY